MTKSRLIALACLALGIALAAPARAEIKTRWIEYKQGDTALATSFWPHEVLNALLAGEKRKRISSALSRTFLEELATLPILLEQFASGIVFERIESLSRRHDLTAYDAAYLDLALENGIPLATLDEDLIRACRKAGAELLQT